VKGHASAVAKGYPLQAFGVIFRKKQTGLTKTESRKSPSFDTIMLQMLISFNC